MYWVGMIFFFLPANLYSGKIGDTQKKKCIFFYFLNNNGMFYNRMVFIYIRDKKGKRKKKRSYHLPTEKYALISYL